VINRTIKIDYLLNLKENELNNAYRAKTLRAQSKITPYFSELGVLCDFARGIFFLIL